MQFEIMGTSDVLKLLKLNEPRLGHKGRLTSRGRLGKRNFTVLTTGKRMSAWEAKLRWVWKDSKFQGDRCSCWRWKGENAQKILQETYKQA